jgi:predicted nuclease of predicted toxin-antitoxin system
MKRLLLDQGLAPRAATILCEQGFEAIHVAEIGMEQVCVTLDHDFHTHLAIAGHGRPSVVLLRVEGLDAQAQADLIRSVCTQCETALSEGAAISADRHSIRVRRLPLR